MPGTRNIFLPPRPSDESEGGPRPTLPAGPDVALPSDVPVGRFVEPEAEPFVSPEGGERRISAPTIPAPKPSGWGDEMRDRVAALERQRAELESRVERYTRAYYRSEASLVVAEAAAAAAEAALRANNARLLAITQGAVDAIITLGDDGRIEEVNPAAARLFGRPPEEMVGRHFETLLPEHTLIDFETLAGAAEAPPGSSGAPPGSGVGVSSRPGAPDSAPHRRFLRTSLAPGASAEIRGRRADGAVFPMQVALSRVRIDGRHMFLAIVRDVSEQKRAEAEHQELNRRIVAASRQAGMAEIASNVLHNVGNVLNSVNVSATVLAERLAASRALGVAKAAALLLEHRDDYGAFLHDDPRGQLLPAYLEQLGEALAEEHRSMSAELDSLRKDIGHIKQIVRTQQTFARTNSDVRELVAPADLMEEALRIAGHTHVNEAIEVSREYDAVPDVRLDRHKVVHVIVNLISNARQAIAVAGRAGQIRLCIGQSGDQHVRMDVADNGVGIPEENLVRVFNYGFTTRPEGHGFGLHGAALWAKELGGSLSAHSLGPGRGARFSLVLPIDYDPARPEGGES
jgi:signal transduction histidine kinase